MSCSKRQSEALAPCFAGSQLWWNSCPQAWLHLDSTGARPWSEPCCRHGVEHVDAICTASVDVNSISTLLTDPADATCGGVQVHRVWDVLDVWHDPVGSAVWPRTHTCAATPGSHRCQEGQRA